MRAYRCLYAVYGVCLHHGVGFAIHGYGRVDALLNSGSLYNLHRGHAQQLIIIPLPLHVPVAV